MVSWGREEFIVLRKVSFVSKPAAASKTVSSGTLAHVEILCEAQQLRTTVSLGWKLFVLTMDRGSQKDAPGIDPTV